MLRRFFALLSASLYILLVLSPGGIFLTHAEGDRLIITTNSLDFCEKNIQCEAIGEGKYECTSAGEILTERVQGTQNYPIGKSEADKIRFETRWAEGLSFRSFASYFSDTSIGDVPYPFVRIIKIQV